MPDPFDQLAADTVERDYGARPPALTPPSNDNLDTLLNEPVRKPAPTTNGRAPMGDSYDQLLDGFFGRNGNGHGPGPADGLGTDVPAAGASSPLPPWPPPMALSPKTEAAFGDEARPTVGPRAKPPGLLSRIGSKLLKSVVPQSREEEVADRGFEAQAEIEARQDPRWKDLGSENAKLRFLNVYRRRYGLDPADKLEPPEDLGAVAGRQWGTLRGLVEKLPFVSEGISAYELGKLHLALSRVEQGKGSIDDWETLTALQEKMAKESRGRTTAGQAMNIASESVPFWMGLGVGEGVTKPLIRGAEKAAEKAIGKSATKAAAEALARMAEKAAAKKTLGQVATHAGFETVKRGLPQMAMSTTADTLRRTLPGYQLLPGDETALDYAIRAPGQDFLGAVRDSGIKATIEVYSEFTGESLGILATKAGRAGQALTAAGAKVPGLRKIAIPAERAGQWVAATRAAIPAALMKAFPNKYATLEAATMHMREIGINNVFEEMGEERIGELMEGTAKAVIGDKSSLENYHVPEFEQLKAEFLGFMIPGAVSKGAAALVPEEKVYEALRQGGYKAFNDRQIPVAENGRKIAAQQNQPGGPSPSQNIGRGLELESAAQVSPPGPGEAEIPEQPIGEPPPMERFPGQKVQGSASSISPGDRPPDVGGEAQQGTTSRETEDLLLDHVLDGAHNGAPVEDQAQHLSPDSEVPRETSGQETEEGGPAGETIEPSGAEAQPQPGAIVRAQARPGDYPAELPTDLEARTPGPPDEAGARGVEEPAGVLPGDPRALTNEEIRRDIKHIDQMLVKPETSNEAAADLWRQRDALTALPQYKPEITIKSAKIIPTRAGIVVQPLDGGPADIITDESTSAAKEKLEGLRQHVRGKPMMTPDTPVRWMGEHAMVKESKIIDGVEYNLAHAKANGYVRIYDLDSQNLVSLKRFPSRSLADEEFRDVIEKSLHNAAKSPTIEKEVPREPGRSTTAPAPDRRAGESPPESHREGGAARPEGRTPADVPGAGGSGATVPLGLGQTEPGERAHGPADRGRDAGPRGVGAGEPGLHRPAAQGVEHEGRQEGKKEEHETRPAHVESAKLESGSAEAGDARPVQPRGDRGEKEKEQTHGTQRTGAGAGEDGGAGDTDRETTGKRGPVADREADSTAGAPAEGTPESSEAVRRRPGAEADAQAGRTGVADKAPADRALDRGGAAGADPGVPGSHAGDYVITDPGNLFATGSKTIFRRNVEAIRTVKKIVAENRPATEEEKATLVQYQGWGSLPEAFLFYDPKWKKEAEELRELLTPEEYKAAEGSTKNAMYTPPAVVSAMWKALERMGFKGGAILEPSAGIGHFFGLQPGAMLPGSRRIAIEKDAITAAIAKALYPGSNVRHSPFEDAALAKNYFDLAISNVPFGKLFINDKRYPAYLRQFIHDYFFARSIDLVRPGGLVAFITTKGTMDKGDDRVRRYVAERADFLGAIRLNDKSLPGTQVTTDIIFLKKRAEREPAGGEAWVNSRAYEPLPGKIINEYFQKHPEMVLGEIKAGSLYSSGEEGPTATIVAAPAGFDLERDVNAAAEHLPKDVFGTTRADITRVDDVADMIPSPANLPAGTMFVSGDKKLYRAAGKGDLAEPIEGVMAAEDGARAVERAKAIVGFRDTVLEVLRVSTDPKGDERLIELQKKLNQQYDALARKGFTPFSSPATSRIFTGDLLTLSLINSPQIEKYDRATKKATKGDIFTRAMLAAYERPTSADNASDALSISLDEMNRIDLDRIGALLGVDPDSAKQRLLNEALAYALPGDQLVLAADYLSGPVRAKLREAEAAAELDPIFQPNVEALKRVQPADVPPSRVRVTLGAPWIPGEAIEDFIIEQAGERFRDMLHVKRSDAIGQWVVSGAKYIVTPKTTQKWGTTDYNMAELVEAAMSMQVPKVVRSEGTGDNKITWTDQPATDAAITKLREVREYFEHWVWAHEKWGPQLLADFNRIYNDSIKRVWDGKHLSLPGSNPLIDLRSYQKDAVYRNIASSYNTVDDIAVGGGKTFIAAATAMEAIRLGLARKVVIVVDRPTLDQFIEGARTLYPGGQFIGLSTKELAPKKRAKTLAAVALADKTVFIMPHNQFKSLPVSEETLLEFYDEMLREIDQAIEDAKNEKSQGGKRVVKRLQAKRDNLEARLKKSIEGVRKIASVPFEELGVDWIIYDEAHRAKNLRFETQMDAVRGLGNPAGSQTALDLLMKTQYVSRLQGGRGITFLTGTPVNNSISEIYAMQRYLQPQTLMAQGIRSFDDWVRVFAEEAADMEKVAGRYKWVTRLRKFKNLKGLYGMWDQIAHSVPHEEVMRVVQAAGGDIPKIALDEKGERNPTMVVRDVTPGQKAYQKVINERREHVLAMLKKGPPQKGDDIMLSIITDEKKASLDMRFIYPDNPEEPGNKLTAAANQIVAVHKEFEQHKLAQLVFLNMGAPGSATAFGAYTDLIGKLTAGGIPREEIATIFDAKTDAQRGQLFKKVNSGEIRVLIGSMKKMGQGVNVQKRLIALHQLEPAWEPGTLIQVMGRILRSGNEIVKLGLDARIFRYVSKGMSDESMYSLLAAKQKVNSDFLSGRLETDEIEDLDISYLAFQMAQAEGAESKTVFEWTKADQQLKRMQGEARYFRDTQIDLRNQIVSATAMVNRAKAMVPRAKAFAKYVKTLPAADPFEMVVGKTTYDDKMTDAGKALFAQAEQLALDEQVRAGSVRGLAMYLRFDKVFGSAQWRATLSLRLPPEAAEHEKFLADAGTKLMATLHWDKSAPPTDRALANWVSEITRDIDGISETPWENQLATQSKKAKDLEEEIGKPFARQKEMDELARHVSKLADQLSKEAEDAARAGEGHTAADLGQGEAEDDDEDGDDSEGGEDEGGASDLGNFPPTTEKLLPDNLTPEYRQWMRENWQHPLFAMGATSAGPPQASTFRGRAWQTYADLWDKSVARMKNMSTKERQLVMDWLARLLYGGQWKLPQEAQTAIDRARGAKHVGSEVSAVFNEKLDQLIQAKRKTEVGKPWPEESWDVVRSTALAVLKGGHRRPEILPADMLKVWKAHFGWVRHVSGDMTPKDRRLEIEFQLEKVNERIEDLRASTLVKNMPDPAWDAFAIAEHRKILDVVNAREDYDSLDANTRDWLETVKSTTDALTDEMLADPLVMEASKGGGLKNFEEIVQLRRQSGGIYLRSLYHIVRDPSILPGMKREGLAPRMVVGMTKAKRAKDLWTVTLGSGQEMQFFSEEEAVAFADQEKALWAAEYGESVHRRITVRDPLTDEQVEWLGPVEDLRVLVAKTITGMYMHMDSARMFAALDKLDALDEKEYADLAEQEKHKYRKLPDSPAFFRLAGKYVPEAMHYNLMESRLAFTGLASEVWSLMLQVFKPAVVLFNPPTWFRQLYGQTVFWILGGLNPLTHRHVFVEAAKRLSKGLADPTVMDLMRRNKLHGGVDKEFAGRFGDALRTPTNGVTAALGQAWNQIRRTKRYLGRGYSFIDHVTIVASWIRDREIEDLPEEIALENLKWYQNYETIGTGAQFLRKFPLGDPFVSFSDQAIKIVLKGMREHPGRVLAMYGAPALLNLSARLIFGVTDEEMLILNSNPQRRGLIDRYFQPVLYRDSAGMVHTIDLRWSMPLASDFRTATGPGGIGIPFILKQPLFGPLVDVLYNRDSYTGKKISKDDAITAWEAIGHVVWESAPLPSIATRAPLRMYRAATGESGENLFQVVLKEVFGVSIMPRYATKADAYKLVREAVGANAASRAVKLIDAYQKLQRPPQLNKPRQRR